MEVRIGTSEDLEAVAAIYLAASGSTELSLSDAVSAKRARFFETAGVDLFVAVDKQGKPVGYASIIRQSPDLPLKPSELDEIHVLPEKRGQGIGTALLAQTRKANHCDTWVRCPRSNETAIAWFKKRGYQYRRTEFTEAGMRTALMRPGQMCAALDLLLSTTFTKSSCSSHRLAVPADVPAMEELFVRCVFRNSEIQHGTSVPEDFLQTMTNRIFPSPQAGVTATATIYLSTDGRLAGFHVIHAVASNRRQVELNMFCSNADLGAKDLGNYMLQRVLEQHGGEAAIMVRTWLVNNRARAFYLKNDFVEVERENPENTAKDGRPAKVTLVRPGPFPQGVRSAT